MRCLVPVAEAKTVAGWAHLPSLAVPIAGDVLWKMVATVRLGGVIRTVVFVKSLAFAL